MVHPLIKYLLKNQVIFALVILALGWFLIQIRDILMLLFCSYIVTAGLMPLVHGLRKYRVPKLISILITFFGTVIVIVLLIVPLVPFFIEQVTSLLVKFPIYFDQAAEFLRIDTSAEQLNSFVGNQLGSLGANAFTFTGIFLGSLFSLILVLVLSFYLLFDQERLKNGVAELFPTKHRKNVVDTLTQIDDRLGAWVRGQVMLSFSIGLFTWIALMLLGFSSVALPLAILAGILEVVPTIGPILSAVPAIIVALAVSPSSTFAVILSYIIIQIIENNILVPKIMQRAVGLNPLVVIIGITIGANLMGILGGLLSIPFISMLVIIFSNTREVLTSD